TLVATFSDGSTATAVTTVSTPATLTLAFNGQLRDRVGQDNVAVGADGALDGPLTATLSAPGGRTVTGLRLDSSAPGTWDTTSESIFWALGAATTLDGPLLNAPGSMAVNFPVTDGGSFVIFASDAQGIEFLPGRTLTLVATFSDGSTGTAVTTVSTPATLTLAFNGQLRDRVGQGNVAVGADGALDGTLTATLSAPGGRTVTGLRLDSSAPGTWDTTSESIFWALGAATTLDGPLLNAPGSMAVNFPVTDGGSFVIFASDAQGIEFLPGRTLTLVATFSDGSTGTAVTTVSTPATLTLAFNGQLRDRVGQGNVAVGADGALDGTLTATLSAPGGRTVTGLRLDSSAPGTWDTTSESIFWALGAATTLDGPLLNAPGSMAVNFPVTDGGSFVIFASDAQGIEFLPGRTLTLVATFSDGSTATAVTTVSTPATLTLAFNGQLRDRVGQDNVAVGADGALDGPLTATLSAPGGRTVTGLRLDSSAPGTWDTTSESIFWALGAATTLDGPLLNAPGSMAVNFPVTDGGSFVIFASDAQGIEFLPGRTLTLVATFSDGSTATAVTTVSTPATLTLAFNGQLRDRVGQDNVAVGADGALDGTLDAPRRRDRVGQDNVGVGADGALDGTLTATLSAPGGRTVTGLRLDSSAPGTWDTTSESIFWALGAATTLDGPLLNAPGSMAVNFPVTDGGSFVIFASD